MLGPLAQISRTKGPLYVILISPSPGSDESRSNRVKPLISIPCIRSLPPFRGRVFPRQYFRPCFHWHQRIDSCFIAEAVPFSHWCNCTLLLVHTPTLYTSRHVSSGFRVKSERVESSRKRILAAFQPACILQVFFLLRGSAFDSPFRFEQGKMQLLHHPKARFLAGGSPFHACWLTTVDAPQPHYNSSRVLPYFIFLPATSSTLPTIHPPKLSSITSNHERLLL